MSIFDNPRAKLAGFLVVVAASAAANLAVVNEAHNRTDAVAKVAETSCGRQNEVRTILREILREQIPLAKATPPPPPVKLRVDSLRRAANALALKDCRAVGDAVRNG